MKLKNIFFLMSWFAAFLASCGKCEKLNLSQTEKDWLNHFYKGQKFFYKNAKGQIDTVEITETKNFYTPCNKVELSQYQYEIYDASFIIKQRLTIIIMNHLYLTRHLLINQEFHIFSLAI